MSSLPDACGRLSLHLAFRTAFLHAGQWFDGRCRNAQPPLRRIAIVCTQGSPSAVIGCGPWLCRPVGKRKGHGRPRRRTRPCDTCKGMRSYEGFPSVMRAMHAAFAVHGDACLGGVRSHRRKRRVRRGDDPLSRQRRLGEAVRVHVRRWCALRVLAGRTDGGRRRRLVQRYRECAAWIARTVQRQRKIAAPRNKPTGVRGQWRSLVRGERAGTGIRIVYKIAK